MIQDKMITQKTTKLINNYTNTKAVEKVTGKPFKILQGESRVSSVVSARNLCFKIAKDHLFLADREIAIFFNRDRSAITYALNNIDKKLENRPQYKLTLEAVERELGLRN